MDYLVLNDRLLVERMEPESTTPGGIHIPESVRDRESAARGRVVQVGSGRLLRDGRILPQDVRVGDLVLFGPYSGTEIRIKDKKYSLLREDDVFCVLENGGGSPTAKGES